MTGGFFTYLWVAFLFALVNAILGPILQLISLPITILTLGLFALVVNAALLGITAWLSSHLSVDGFWAAFFGAMLIAIFSAVLGLLIPDRKPRTSDLHPPRGRPGARGRPSMVMDHSIASLEDPSARPRASTPAPGRSGQPSQRW